MPGARDKVQFDLIESERKLLGRKWTRFWTEADRQISLSSIEQDLHNLQINNNSILQKGEQAQANQMRIGNDEFLLKKLKEQKLTKLQREHRLKCILKF